jgi:hypothetical protein
VSSDVFVKFEYDERDIANGMRLRLAGKLRGALLGVAVGVIGCGAAWTLGPERLRSAALGGLLGAVLVFVIAALYKSPPTMFRGTFTASREAEAGPEELRDATMTIDASEDGIAVTVGKRLANLKWSECTRLESDARSYVLSHGKDGFVVIPRRAFRNEKRDAAFRELAGRLLRQGA